MMPTDLASARTEVDAALNGIGLRLADLCRAASQVILFGSRAAGVADDTSDWDILCVGGGQRIRTRNVDIVWVSPTIICTELWLGSELAAHVASYGRWLTGSQEWRHTARLSVGAVAGKVSAIESMVKELNRLWPHLVADVRIKYIRRVLLDVQRLQIMMRGEPVPPRAHLEQMGMLRDRQAQDLSGVARTLAAVLSSDGREA